MKLKLNLTAIINRKDSSNDETLTVRKDMTYIDSFKVFDPETPAHLKKNKKSKSAYDLPALLNDDFKTFYKNYSKGKLIKVIRRRPFSPISLDKMKSIRLNSQTS